MTIDTETPQQVVRFYGNVDYAMDIIKNRQIAFVHVSTLNDPFDPYYFFETDFGDSYQNLITYVRRNHPSNLRWFREHITPQSWGQTVKELKAHLQTARETAFVLSTSSAHSDSHPKDNLYMWGHYANGHRGLAIEFDTQALASAVLKQHEAETGKPLEDSNIWTKIEYTKTFAPITAEMVYEFMKQEMKLSKRKGAVRAATQLDRYYKRMTIIKSDVWQSENEWRLLWRSAETQEKVHKCPIGEDAVASIFLGLSLAAEKAEELIAAARQNFPASSILRAHKRHGDLALEFRQP
jgi:hypothetical protein